MLLLLHCQILLSSIHEISAENLQLCFAETTLFTVAVAGTYSELQYPLDCQSTDSYFARPDWLCLAVLGLEAAEHLWR